MAASGQRINKRKKKIAKICKNDQKNPKKNQKKTYLGPKQCDLRHHLGLEMVEMGALWLHLVKESTKEKKNSTKISQNDRNKRNNQKKNIPWVQTMHFDMLFGP